RITRDTVACDTPACRATSHPLTTVPIPHLGRLPATRKPVAGELAITDLVTSLPLRDAPGPAVILIAPPGWGKSPVGPLLATRLGVAFAETDGLVADRAGKPV